jgi:hypothetical protein
MSRNRGAVLTLVIGLGLIGCSHRVRVIPNPIVSVEEKIEVRVGLHIPGIQALQTHSADNTIGGGGTIFDTWSVETGSALWLGAERTFKSMFTEVESVDDEQDFHDKGLALMITPRIGMFRISPGMAATLNLQCTIVDHDGQVIYDNSVSAQSQGHAGRAIAMGCLGGMAGGHYGKETGLQDASKEAFDSAFARLASDIMTSVDFNPYTGN